MAKFGIKIKVNESESQIANIILNCLQSELNTVLDNTARNLKPLIKNLLESRITNDDTWQSLNGGELQGEFGLDTSTVSRLGDILDIWLKSINIDYKPVTITGSTLKGGIVLDMVKDDWSDVLASPAATITTDKGDVLPWLEWLLINGSKIIIRDYDVVMKSSSRSRSGMALMVKNPGRGRWRVPPAYSGTSNNNFITKILENIEDDIVTIIENEVVSRL